MRYSIIVVLLVLTSFMCDLKGVSKLSPSLTVVKPGSKAINGSHIKVYAQPPGAYKIVAGDGTIVTDGKSRYPLILKSPDDAPLCRKGEGVLISMLVKLVDYSGDPQHISLSMLLSNGKKHKYPSIGYTKAVGDKYARLSGWYFCSDDLLIPEKITLIVPSGIKVIVDKIKITYTPDKLTEDKRLPLHIEGRKIMVGNKQIILNGVNLTAYQEDLQHALSSISEDDYRDSAAAGFNTVRLNVGYPAFANEGGWQWLNIQRYWAQKNGLRIILDLHAPPGKYQGPEYRGKFWKSDDEALKLRNETVAFWKDAASRYKNDATIAVFDLLNEPKPKKNSQWWDLVEKMVAAIRSTGCKTPVIAEKTIDEDDFRKLDDDGIIYDTHFYTPWRFTSGKEGTYNTKCIDYYEKGATLNKAWLLKIIKEDIIDFSVKYNVPINVGEYGVTNSALKRGGAEWLRDMRDIFREYNINCQYWCWFGYEEWSLDNSAWFRYVPQVKRDEVISIIAE